MVEKIEFTNNNGRDLEVIVEPTAETFNLLVKETLLIELTPISTLYEDELALVLETEALIIYEKRQCDTRIYINGELKYYTASNMPRI